MRRSRTIALLFAACTLQAVTFLVLPTELLAQKGGKGGGKEGGGGDPPPVVYQVQYFYAPSGYGDIRKLYDTNNHRQTVGQMGGDVDGDGMYDWEVAFLYDPQADPSTALDLNAITTGIPEGWVIWEATAINEWGDIAASLQPIGQTTLGTLRAAMIEMDYSDPTQPTGVVHLVPDGALTNYSGVKAMNDLGDIVATFKNPDGSRSLYLHNFGLYNESWATPSPIIIGPQSSTSREAAINNLGQVAYLDASGVTIRTTIGGSADLFTGLESVFAMNTWHLHQ